MIMETNIPCIVQTTVFRTTLKGIKLRKLMITFRVEEQGCLGRGIWGFLTLVIVT